MVRVKLTLATKCHYEALYVWLKDFIERLRITLIQCFRQSVPEVERNVSHLQRGTRYIFSYNDSEVRYTDLLQYFLARISAPTGYLTI